MLSASLQATSSTQPMSPPTNSTNVKWRCRHWLRRPCQRIRFKRQQCPLAPRVMLPCREIAAKWRQIRKSLSGTSDACGILKTCKKGFLCCSSESSWTEPHIQSTRFILQRFYRFTCTTLRPIFLQIHNFTSMFLLISCFYFHIFTWMARAHK